MLAIEASGHRRVCQYCLSYSTSFSYFPIAWQFDHLRWLRWLSYPCSTYHHQLTYKTRTSTSHLSTCSIHHSFSNDATFAQLQQRHQAWNQSSPFIKEPAQPRTTPTNIINPRKDGTRPWYSKAELQRHGIYVQRTKTTTTKTTIQNV